MILLDFVCELNLGKGWENLLFFFQLRKLKYFKNKSRVIEVLNYHLSCSFKKKKKNQTYTSKYRFSTSKLFPIKLNSQTLHTLQLCLQILRGEEEFGEEKKTPA